MWLYFKIIIQIYILLRRLWKLLKGRLFYNVMFILRGDKEKMRYCWKREFTLEKYAEEIENNARILLPRIWIKGDKKFHGRMIWTYWKYITKLITFSLFSEAVNSPDPVLSCNGINIGNIHAGNSQLYYNINTWHDHILVLKFTS